MNRAFFYAFADNEGAARGERGGPCRAGNYEPALLKPKNTYPVSGRWHDEVSRAYKLSLDKREPCVFLADDGRKKNIDAVRARGEQIARMGEIQERTKRLRANPDIQQSFQVVLEAQAWLNTCKQEAARCPMLVVFAPSRSKKIEWAKSLFQRPSKREVGVLKNFPDEMRGFDRNRLDGPVLDDVRDLKFLDERRGELQGNFDASVEFASTTGGTCAYYKDLHRAPVVVAINRSTENLLYLATHDFICKEENAHFVAFSGRPGEAPPRAKWPLEAWVCFEFSQLAPVLSSRILPARGNCASAAS